MKKKIYDNLINHKGTRFINSIDYILKNFFEVSKWIKI